MRLAHKTIYIYVHTTPGGACLNRNLIALTNLSITLHAKFVKYHEL